MNVEPIEKAEHCLTKSLFGYTNSIVMGKIFDQFRARLVVLVRSKGLKQEEFAEKIGIGTSYFYHLIRGDRRFNEETIEAICEVLNVTPCELFSNAQPPPPVIQRITQHYDIDLYRKGIEYWEEQTYQTCVVNGLITPEQK